MSVFETLPGHPVMEALGWALLHFIWQGALIAVLTANVMSLLRRRAAEVRYLVACAAMLLMLAFPIVTTVTIAASTPGKFSLTSNTSSGQSMLAAGGRMTVAREAAPLEPPFHLWRERLTGPIADWLPWLISTWLAGVLLLSLRLLIGYVSAQRLKMRETRPVAGRWQETLLFLCARLGVTQSVRLLESAMVQVPTAVGWLRPVILLPACALTGLTPRQLEAVIAHELAHIRRHDYLVNILQRMIETLLFYHPAVWWVSRQVRIEREYCCDDLAVAACGDALLYARALAEMEEMRAEPQVAVAANGGLLIDRIRRLVGIPETQLNGLAGSLAGLIALLTIVALLASSRSLASAPSLRSRQSQNATQVTFEKIASAWEGRFDEAPDLTASEITVNSERNELRGNSTFNADESPTLPAEEDSARPALPAKEAAPAREGATIPNHFDQQKQVPSQSTSDGQYVESLLNALNDEDFQVRDDAITELGRLGDRRAVGPLIVLLKDPNVYIRDNAINSLGLIGDRHAVGPLLESLREQNVYIRDNAITALGRLRDPRAVEPLIALLGDRNVYLRDNAACALGEIGDRRAIEPLRAALNDENWYVRETAARSLERLSGN